MNEAKKEAKVKIIPLGGVGEIAKNMYVVEVDDEMFILDAGLMFPEDEMLGVDIVIPDITYVQENKQKLKGIFLSHGHEDSIGAIPYIIESLNVPIYGSKLTLALVKDRLKAKGVNKKVKFYTINSQSRMKFKNAEMVFFETSHSIPDSYGVSLETKYGSIVYTGEFKFDQSLTGEYGYNMAKMYDVAKKDVLALISDSTEAERRGYNTPENIIEEHILDGFARTRGRIIVSCYASNFVRIQQVLTNAAKTRRKVSFLGRTLESSFKVARNMGYFDIPEGLLVPSHEIGDYPDNEVVIIATGSQGEPIEALGRMSRGQHEVTNIKEGDNVYILTTPSSSMEVILYSTMNELVKAGAHVATPEQNIHASGHGMSEELKTMLNVMKPKHFIPVQGEFKMQIAHAKLAAETGVAPENIFLLEKGDIVSYDGNKMISADKVTAGNVLIDGSGVGDVGNIVLRDRRLLSEDGIFIAVVTIDPKKRRIMAGPEIQSRGFVYVKESEDLLKEAEQRVYNIVLESMDEKKLEWSTLKQSIRDDLGKYLYDNTKRRPMIIPIISEI
ncbi:ribonuclease J [Salinicoccus roseus]|uniref:Ribonuclease J n=1 Tax=Salinicoccus roseus TaxID=45670 RepID=A0A265EAP1_9STAP|nr:ribonuclease J [Salinicoccus roseus]MBY8908795.1 ribonuclease J [Salinicoccus roseus]OZT78338.1 Zn-dependent hydrolase [Salinicoccus roseus]RPE54423.1 ribonuclease J [Salinicoccus roseus]GGA65652.1 ribonuclease J 2 [Salinicoccus roseus]